MHMRQTSSCAKPGAGESLYRCSNEPGENVKQTKMKQTLWSISCSTSWISNSSSELQWKGWLTSGGRGQSSSWGKEMGVSGGGDLRDLHKSTAWYIQFSTDQQMPFFRLGLNYPIWQHHYVWDYYMLSRRFGLFILPIVDNDWSTPWEQRGELISDNPRFTSSSSHPPSPSTPPPLFPDTLANQLKGRAWQLLTSHSI